MQQTPAPAFVFQKIGATPLPRFETLLKANPDVIGWLNIRGELDLPVVYRDNEYYLTRDVYRKKSPAGTLFLDKNHPFAATAQYLVIHGHNMKDGSMFGRLAHYLELSYLQKHCIVQLDTLYQKDTYVVFAVLVVSENVHEAGFINFLGYPSFSSPDQFMEFVNGLKDKSKFAIPVTVDATDALLTLSTCYGDDRLIIVARRVRPGESASSLKAMVGYALKK
jgi:sortase B